MLPQPSESTAVEADTLFKSKSAKAKNRRKNCQGARAHSFATGPILFIYIVTALFFDTIAVMAKIVFTGGGTGGHFYPIIAVAQAVNDIVAREKLLQPKLYYFGPTKYDERSLFEQSIDYRYVPAGKIRLYKSLKNIPDSIKTFFGILKAIFSIFTIYPDVIFSKGGYASFPILVAGRIFGIPVVIHESDTVPGRVNLWASKFADAIAVSYPQVQSHFKNKHIVHTGNPIRKELMRPEKEGAHEFLQLEPNVPVILILGGSQGAQRINDAIIQSLSRLVEKYQIIHQVGDKNIDEVASLANVELKENKYKDRYKPYAFLNTLAIRMAAGAADVIVTRAGSSLFEIAVWGVPSIVIPIPQEISRDQRSNAFAYASSGAARVIEENNLNDDILISQIDEIITNPEVRNKMTEGAKKMAHTDASEKIAKQLLHIALLHEV